MEAVRVEQLAKRFGNFWAVRGISFTVQQGEIFGFLGPNGAGKSTTIKMLCGILAPSSGRGLVAGYDVGRHPERVKSTLGYMSQRFSLYDDLTVEENIDFYSGIYRLSGRKQRERKAWVLAMAGLRGRERSLPRELSGGWKQRLALGCALLHEPSILFLDEPTAGVDPISRRRFWDLIVSLAGAGTTVFVTTHYMDEAEHCQRLALINQGELKALGTVPELKESFQGGEIWELDAAPQDRAIETLREMPRVTQVTPFGSVTRVGVARGVARGDIEHPLNEHGISILRLEQTQPSLEDVFVALTKETPA